MKGQFTPLPANLLSAEISTWEGEGGALAGAPPTYLSLSLQGTASQVEWARRIRILINQDFDRVARAFRAVAARQSEARRDETRVILEILEEKRADVLSRDQAGYFIQRWQEIGDQIRRMIFRDPRYQAIKRNQNGAGSMNIRPLYDRIVVRRIEDQEATRSGIIIPESAKEKPRQGEVVAVGRGTMLANGERAAVSVSIGDRVLFGKFSGTEAKQIGEEYLILREDEVLGILEPSIDQ